MQENNPTQEENLDIKWKVVKGHRANPSYPENAQSLKVSPRPSITATMKVKVKQKGVEGGKRI